MSEEDARDYERGRTMTRLLIAEEAEVTGYKKTFYYFLGAKDEIIKYLSQKKPFSQGPFKK